MNKKNNILKTIISSCVLTLLLVMLGGLDAENVQAATPKFKMDSYNMSVGDMVYVPYLTNSSAGSVYLTQEDLDESPYSEYEAVWYYADNPNHFGYNTLIGQKSGSTTIYAFDENGDSYDTMILNVSARPAFSLSGTTTVNMQPGQIVRSFRVVPGETNTYHFKIQGSHYSEIYVSTKDYGSIVGHAVGNGNTTSLDVRLEANKEYYIDFTTFDINSSSLTAPNANVTLNVTVTKNAKATGVSLHVNAYALKIEGDTYYMMEGDAFDLKVVFEGGANVEKENFDIVTTNSAIASINSVDKTNGTAKVHCGAAGTVDVSITTSNMHKDSFKVVVIGKDELIPGDVNLDGTITKADIQNVYAVTKGLANKTRVYYHADMNGDGELNDEDIKLLWEVVGGLPYVDIAESDWFYDAVEYNYNEKTMTGMNSIQFGPYESLSRAQFALILYRMQNTPEVTVENPFKDIVGNEWYAEAVLWAFDNSIVTGFGDNTFRPADLITREQMVAMMYRYANYLEEDTSVKAEYEDFIDAGSVSEYAEEAMQWAVGNGILTGKKSDEGSMLAPWGATARAEAAAIIQRYMEK